MVPLPPLAGICSMEDAMRDGLSVEECVRRLKRLHYAFKRLHGIFNARITAEPRYELKSAFSHHAYLCAEHVSALRQRVGEMREPPLGLDAVPDPNLEILFDEILAAPTTEELLGGVYGVAVEALMLDIETHGGATNPLADAPTVRLCRFAALELRDMYRTGGAAREALAPDRACDWVNLLLRDCLEAAGGFTG